MVSADGVAFRAALAQYCARHMRDGNWPACLEALHGCALTGHDFSALPYEQLLPFLVRHGQWPALYRLQSSLMPAPYRLPPSTATKEPANTARAASSSRLALKNKELAVVLSMERDGAAPAGPSTSPAAEDSFQAVEKYAENTVPSFTNDARRSRRIHLGGKRRSDTREVGAAAAQAAREEGVTPQTAQQLISLLVELSAESLPVAVSTGTSTSSLATASSGARCLPETSADAAEEEHWRVRNICQLVKLAAAHRLTLTDSAVDSALAKLSQWLVASGGNGLSDTADTSSAASRQTVLAVVDVLSADAAERAQAREAKQGRAPAADLDRDVHATGDVRSRREKGDRAVSTLQDIEQQLLMLTRTRRGSGRHQASAQVADRRYSTSIRRLFFLASSNASDDEVMRRLADYLRARVAAIPTELLDNGLVCELCLRVLLQHRERFSEPAESRRLTHTLSMAYAQVLCLLHSDDNAENPTHLLVAASTHRSDTRAHALPPSANLLPATTSLSSHGARLQAKSVPSLLDGWALAVTALTDTVDGLGVALASGSHPYSLSQLQRAVDLLVYSTSALLSGTRAEQSRQWSFAAGSAPLARRSAKALARALDVCAVAPSTGEEERNRVVQQVVKNVMCPVNPVAAGAHSMAPSQTPLWWRRYVLGALNRLGNLTCVLTACELTSGEESAANQPSASPSGGARKKITRPRRALPVLASSRASRNADLSSRTAGAHARKTGPDALAACSSLCELLAYVMPAAVPRSGDGSGWRDSSTLRMGGRKRLMAAAQSARAQPLSAASTANLEEEAADLEFDLKGFSFQLLTELEESAQRLSRQEHYSSMTKQEDGSNDESAEVDILFTLTLFRAAGKTEASEEEVAKALVASLADRYVRSDTRQDPFGQLSPSRFVHLLLGAIPSATRYAAGLSLVSHLLSGEEVSATACMSTSRIGEAPCDVTAGIKHSHAQRCESVAIATVVRLQRAEQLSFEEKVTAVRTLLRTNEEGASADQHLAAAHHHRAYLAAKLFAADPSVLCHQYAEALLLDSTFAAEERSTAVKTTASERTLRFPALHRDTELMRSSLVKSCSPLHQVAAAVLPPSTLDAAAQGHVTAPAWPQVIAMLRFASARTLSHVPSAGGGEPPARYSILGRSLDTGSRTVACPPAHGRQPLNVDSTTGEWLTEEESSRLRAALKGHAGHHGGAVSPVRAGIALFRRLTREHKRLRVDELECFAWVLRGGPASFTAQVLAYCNGHASKTLALAAIDCAVNCFYRRTRAAKTRAWGGTSSGRNPRERLESPRTGSSSGVDAASAAAVADETALSLQQCEELVYSALKILPSNESPLLAPTRQACSRSQERGGLRRVQGGRTDDAGAQETAVSQQNIAKIHAKLLRVYASAELRTLPPNGKAPPEKEKSTEEKPSNASATKRRQREQQLAMVLWDGGLYNVPAVSQARSELQRVIDLCTATDDAVSSAKAFAEFKKDWGQLAVCSLPTKSILALIGLEVHRLRDGAAPHADSEAHPQATGANTADLSQSVATDPQYRDAAAGNNIGTHDAAVRNVSVGSLTDTGVVTSWPAEREPTRRPSRPVSTSSEPVSASDCTLIDLLNDYFLAHAVSTSAQGAYASRSDCIAVKDALCTVFSLSSAEASAGPGRGGLVPPLQVSDTGSARASLLWGEQSTMVQFVLFTCLEFLRNRSTVPPFHALEPISAENLGLLVGVLRALLLDKSTTDTMEKKRLVAVVTPWLEKECARLQACEGGQDAAASILLLWLRTFRECTRGCRDDSPSGCEAVLESSSPLHGDSLLIIQAEPSNFRRLQSALRENAQLCTAREEDFLCPTESLARLLFVSQFAALHGCASVAERSSTPALPAVLLAAVSDVAVSSLRSLSPCPTSSAFGMDPSGESARTEKDFTGAKVSDYEQHCLVRFAAVSSLCTAFLASVQQYSMWEAVGAPPRTVRARAALTSLAYVVNQSFVEYLDELCDFWETRGCTFFECDRATSAEETLSNTSSAEESPSVRANAADRRVFLSTLLRSAYVGLTSFQSELAWRGDTPARRHVRNTLQRLADQFHRVVKVRSLPLVERVALQLLVVALGNDSASLGSGDALTTLDHFKQQVSDVCSQVNEQEGANGAPFSETLIADALPLWAIAFPHSPVEEGSRMFLEAARKSRTGKNSTASAKNGTTDAVTESDGFSAPSGSEDDFLEQKLWQPLLVTPEAAAARFYSSLLADEAASADPEFPPAACTSNALAENLHISALAAALVRQRKTGNTDLAEGNLFHTKQSPADVHADGRLGAEDSTSMLWRSLLRRGADDHDVECADPVCNYASWPVALFPQITSSPAEMALFVFLMNARAESQRNGHEGIDKDDGELLAFLEELSVACSNRADLAFVAVTYTPVPGLPNVHDERGSAHAAVVSRVREALRLFFPWPPALRALLVRRVYESDISCTADVESAQRFLPQSTAVLAMKPSRTQRVIELLDGPLHDSWSKGELSYCEWLAEALVEPDVVRAARSAALRSSQTQDSGAVLSQRLTECAESSPRCVQLSFPESCFTTATLRRHERTAWKRASVPRSHTGAHQETPECFVKSSPSVPDELSCQRPAVLAALRFLSSSPRSSSLEKIGVDGTTRDTANLDSVPALLTSGGAFTAPQYLYTWLARHPALRDATFTENVYCRSLLHDIACASDFSDIASALTRSDGCGSAHSALVALDTRAGDEFLVLLWNTMLIRIAEVQDLLDRTRRGGEESLSPQVKVLYERFLALAWSLVPAEAKANCNRSSSRMLPLLSEVTAFFLAAVWEMKGLASTPNNFHSVTVQTVLSEENFTHADVRTVVLWVQSSPFGGLLSEVLRSLATDRTASSERRTTADLSASKSDSEALACACDLFSVSLWPPSVLEVASGEETLAHLEGQCRERVLRNPHSIVRALRAVEAQARARDSGYLAPVGAVATEVFSLVETGVFRLSCIAVTATAAPEAAPKTGSCGSPSTRVPAVSGAGCAIVVDQLVRLLYYHKGKSTAYFSSLRAVVDRIILASMPVPELSKGGPSHVGGYVPFAGGWHLVLPLVVERNGLRRSGTGVSEHVRAVHRILETVTATERWLGSVRDRACATAGAHAHKLLRPQQLRKRDCQQLLTFFLRAWWASWMFVSPTGWHAGRQAAVNENWTHLLGVLARMAAGNGVFSALSNKEPCSESRANLWCPDLEEVLVRAFAQSHGAAEVAGGPPWWVACRVTILHALLRSCAEPADRQATSTNSPSASAVPSASHRLTASQLLRFLTGEWRCSAMSDPPAVPRSADAVLLKALHSTDSSARQRRRKRGPMTNSARVPNEGIAESLQLICQRGEVPSHGAWCAALKAALGSADSCARGLELYLLYVPYMQPTTSASECVLELLVSSIFARRTQLKNSTRSESAPLTAMEDACLHELLQRQQVQLGPKGASSLILLYSACLCLTDQASGCRTRSAADRILWRVVREVASQDEVEFAATIAGVANTVRGRGPGAVLAIVNQLIHGCSSFLISFPHHQTNFDVMFLSVGSRLAQLRASLTSTASLNEPAEFTPCQTHFLHDVKQEITQLASRCAHDAEGRHTRAASKCPLPRARALQLYSLFANTFPFSSSGESATFFPAPDARRVALLHQHLQWIHSMLILYRVREDGPTVPRLAVGKLQSIAHAAGAGSDCLGWYPDALGVAACRLAYVMAEAVSTQAGAFPSVSDQHAAYSIALCGLAEVCGTRSCERWEEALTISTFLAQLQKAFEASGQRPEKLSLAFGYKCLAYIAQSCDIHSIPLAPLLSFVNDFSRLGSASATDDDLPLEKARNRRRVLYSLAQRLSRHPALTWQDAIQAADCLSVLENKLQISLPSSRPEAQKGATARTNFCEGYITAAYRRGAYIDILYFLVCARYADPLQAPSHPSRPAVAEVIASVVPAASVEKVKDLIQARSPAGQRPVKDAEIPPEQLTALTSRCAALDEVLGRGAASRPSKSLLRAHLAALDDLLRNEQSGAAAEFVLQHAYLFQRHVCVAGPSSAGSAADTPRPRSTQDAARVCALIRRQRSHTTTSFFLALLAAEKNAHASGGLAHEALRWQDVEPGLLAAALDSFAQTASADAAVNVEELVRGAAVLCTALAKKITSATATELAAASCDRQSQGAGVIDVETLLSVLQKTGTWMSVVLSENNERSAFCSAWVEKWPGSVVFASSWEEEIAQQLERSTLHAITGPWLRSDAATLRHPHEDTRNTELTALLTEFERVVSLLPPHSACQSDSAGKDDVSRRVIASSVAMLSLAIEELATASRRHVVKFACSLTSTLLERLQAMPPSPFCLFAASRIQLMETFLRELTCVRDEMADGNVSQCSPDHELGRRTAADEDLQVARWRDLQLARRGSSPCRLLAVLRCTGEVLPGAFFAFTRSHVRRYTQLLVDVSEGDSALYFAGADALLAVKAHDTRTGRLPFSDAFVAESVANQLRALLQKQSCYLSKDSCREGKHADALRRTVCASELWDSVQRANQLVCGLSESAVLMQLPASTRYTLFSCLTAGTCAAGNLLCPRTQSSNDAHRKSSSLACCAQKLLFDGIEELITEDELVSHLRSIARRSVVALQCLRDLVANADATAGASAPALNTACTRVPAFVQDVVTLSLDSLSRRSGIQQHRPQGRAGTWKTVTARSATVDAFSGLMEELLECATFAPIVGAASPPEMHVSTANGVSSLPGSVASALTLTEAIVSTIRQHSLVRFSHSAKALIKRACIDAHGSHWRQPFVELTVYRPVVKRRAQEGADSSSAPSRLPGSHSEAQHVERLLRAMRTVETYEQRRAVWCHMTLAHPAIALPWDVYQLLFDALVQKTPEPVHSEDSVDSRASVEEQVARLQQVWNELEGLFLAVIEDGLTPTSATIDRAFVHLTPAATADPLCRRVARQRQLHLMKLLTLLPPITNSRHKDAPQAERSNHSSGGKASAKPLASASGRSERGGAAVPAVSARDDAHLSADVKRYALSSRSVDAFFTAAADLLWGIAGARAPSPESRDEAQQIVVDVVSWYAQWSRPAAMSTDALNTCVRALCSPATRCDAGTTLPCTMAALLEAALSAQPAETHGHSAQAARVALNGRLVDNREKYAGQLPSSAAVTAAHRLLSRQYTLHARLPDECWLHEHFAAVTAVLTGPCESWNPNAPESAASFLLAVAQNPALLSPRSRVSLALTVAAQSLWRTQWLVHDEPPKSYFAPVTATEPVLSTTTPRATVEAEDSAPSAAANVWLARRLSETAERNFDVAQRLFQPAGSSALSSFLLVAEDSGRVQDAASVSSAFELLGSALQEMEPSSPGDMSLVCRQLLLRLLALPATEPGPWWGEVASPWLQGGTVRAICADEPAPHSKEMDSLSNGGGTVSSGLPANVIARHVALDVFLLARVAERLQVEQRTALSSPGRRERERLIRLTAAALGSEARADGQGSESGVSHGILYAAVAITLLKD